MKSAMSTLVYSAKEIKTIPNPPPPQNSQVVPNRRLPVAPHPRPRLRRLLRLHRLGREGTELLRQRAPGLALRVDHLVGLGLDDTQFRATGYGPKQAIADNSTVEGRAQNRRIEFKLKN